MTQGVISRIWNRLVARYDKDSDGGCCGPTIEEVPADEKDESSESCCN